MSKKEDKELDIELTIIKGCSKGGADPSPLGLAALGLATLLLNIHNLKIPGWETFDPTVLGTGLFFGGFAQVVTGLLDYVNGNTFGFVVFFSYGIFWVSLSLIHILPAQFGFPPPGDAAMSFFLLSWTLFSIFPTIGIFTLKILHVMQIIFILLLTLFGLLTFENLLRWNQSIFLAEIVQRIAGGVGIILGLLAMYTCGAKVVNSELGERRMFPVLLEISVPQAKKYVGFARKIFNRK